LVLFDNVIEAAIPETRKSSRGGCRGGRSRCVTVAERCWFTGVQQDWILY